MKMMRFMFSEKYKTENFKFCIVAGKHDSVKTRINELKIWTTQK